MEKSIDNIKNMYAGIKKWFWALPIWKRAILTSLVGAFGGSSIIAFVNRYALYYHAICQNFRVPVEGVQYLDLAVSLLSFLILATSIIGSILIYSLINAVSEFITNFLIKSKKVKNKTITKSLIIVVQLIITIFASYASFFAKFSKTSTNEFEAYLKTELVILSIFITAFIIIGYFVSTNENRKRIFTISIVLTFISIIAISMFNQTVYSNFLKKIRYGGSIPISLEYRKADNTQSLTSGLLLIRTKNSITIKIIENNTIEEIPNDRISKIIFKE